MTETCRVLLVEDNPHDVEITLSLLADSGLDLEVTVVHDGAEAMDYLYRRGEFRLRRREPPSVLLLDVKMPRVDGLEVLKKLKGDPAMKGISVLLLTSSRQEQDMLGAYALHADDYLVKPVRAAQLATAIGRALQRGGGP
jgi:CheY-like chemotaxis protein